MIVDNKDIYMKLKEKHKLATAYMSNKLITEPFYKGFVYEFCWSSNSIEGNTLSLDETIQFLDYDEVSSGHTFNEYTEAKRLNNTIKKYMSIEGQCITEDWIRNINTEITENVGYRSQEAYIGNQIEVTYYPPSYKQVPELMTNFVSDINKYIKDIEDIIKIVSIKHIEFERIHPFEDGNGRTGRIILNQQLINRGLYPVSIDMKSKYRQAFRAYDKNGDTSLMERLICKAEIKSFDKVLELGVKYKKSLQPVFSIKK